jgi:transcriptional regulator with XRE-family HTH domain
MHLLYSPAELAQEVGRNAKALRLAKNLSRKTLAAKSGISESTIKRFEMTGAINFEALVLLATALDETAVVAKLFKPDHPATYEELKNAKRKRGVK